MFPFFDADKAILPSDTFYHPILLHINFNISTNSKNIESNAIAILFLAFTQYLILTLIYLLLKKF